MKLHPDEVQGVNVISHFEAGQIRVNGVPQPGNVLVPWSGEVLKWTASSFESLTAEDFAQLVAMAPEIVLFGSGGKLRFAKPALLRPLIDKRIGVETMDSGAACRTFNVLAGEGRRVVTALLMAA